MYFFTRILAQPTVRNIELDLETPSVQVIACEGVCLQLFSIKDVWATRQVTSNAGKEMIDKLDSSLRFHQEALNLRARRQEVLSANIAHADTPNFKARDFDFSSTLSQAVERGRQSQSLTMATTSARHLSGEAHAVD